MRCPACQNKVETDAWLCPVCEHIIDPSVLEDADGSSDDLAASEPTKMVAMPPPHDDDAPYPDAVILGDVGIAENEFAVVEGAGVQSDGRTSTFLYYATGSSTRVVHPDAIPRLTQLDGALPRTPYEDFILSCIDGQRSVRAIQKASGLAPQEVVVTLLTLMDKGSVEIRTTDGGPGASRPDGRLQPTADRAADDAPAKPAKRTKRKRARRRSRSASPPPPSSGTLPEVAPQPLDANERLVTQAAAAIPKSARAPIPLGFDEDLPSVSDFHEISEVDEETADITEAIDLEATQQGDELPVLSEPVLPEPSHRILPDDETQLGEPPKSRPLSRGAAVSGVWADSASGALDAEALIEGEESVDEPDRPQSPAWGPLRTPAAEDPSPQLPGSFLADFDDGTDELDEAPLVVPSPMDPPSDYDDDELEPVIPSDLDDDDDNDVTKEVFIPAKLRPPRGADHPTSGARGPAKRRARSAIVASVGSVGSAADAPILDPSLLQRVDPSTSARAAAPRAVSAPDEVRARSRAKKRGPVQERDRRSIINEAPEPAPAAKPPEPAAPPEAEAPRPDPVDSVRMMKGQKLFDQALKDKAEGNILSARMNMKLALTFDPGNDLFKEALADMDNTPEAKSSSPRPTGRSKAREYYDAATEAENLGDVDAAVEMLEKAISESKQPAFLNRLGVILAMKKQEFSRAQQLIEQAIELSPGNGTYEKNLHKILSRAAAADMSPGRSEAKKGGLLGFLGRRK